MPLTAVVVLVFVALILAGCGGGDAEDEASLPTATVQSTAAVQPAVTATTADDQSELTAEDATPTSGPEAEAAREIVEAFDPEADDAIVTLNELAFPEGEMNTVNIVPALAPLLQAEDANQRWAALYVVALVTDTPEEIAVLRTMLADPDLTFRVQAAGSLAGLGVVEALPVLIEGLEQELDMPYSDPPLSVAEHALATLEYYTGQSFEDPAGWQGWWESVAGSIRWDGERYVAS